ncbi:MAG: MarR family transcriptional regulator [Candidatus Thorarchaeota archaeon]
MTEEKSWSIRLDVVLVLVAIITLSLTVWIWISASPISRETVIVATTIALVIALVLVINVAILIVMRLQSRVSHLEGVIAERDTSDVIEDEPQVIVVTLTNTERRIINRLEENGGSMAQDELRRATGLSKSTLSVTLSGLERKSLISRIVSGRTKIVQLEKKVPR